MIGEFTHKAYLDFNASTAVAPEVLAEMLPYLEGLVGNPSSQHWAGQPYRIALEQARQRVATLLSARKEEIYFTSGGSESNNWAIKGAFFASEKNRRHIVSTQIEHPSVTAVIEYLKKFGAEVTYVSVDSKGTVHPKVLEKAMRADTFLVSVMHANNEVGTIQPIKEIAKIAKAHAALMHVDAAQSLGKIEVDVKELGVDLLSIAGHKLYAPKGVGALYIRDGVQIDSLIHGAGHESGMRAGTEAIPLCVGLGKACEISTALSDSKRLLDLKNLFKNLLEEHFGARIVFNGDQENSLPNTLSVSFVGKIGHQILSKIPRIAASTGSACHSGNEKMSSTLTAMGVEGRVGLGTIRFSLGSTTSEQEIRGVVEDLVANV